MKFSTLVIDDDSIFVFLARKMITATGIHPDPQLFPNGKLALDHLASTKGGEAFLIFLDINMPVLDGWGFLDKLDDVGIGDRCTVVIVTSSSDPADRTKAAYYRNVQAYLEKPVTRSVYEELKTRPFMAALLQN